jgi:glycerol-3-phosphate acyltransferase PlsY
MILGAILGFISGIICYVVFSPWIFRGNLTKIQELVAFWSVCITFALIFILLKEMKRIIVVFAVVLLLVFGFYKFNSWNIEREIHRMMNDTKKGIENNRR